MSNTLYASFDDRDQAVKAAGALLDHGVRKEDLSLIAEGGDEDLQRYRSTYSSNGGSNGGSHGGLIGDTTYPADDAGRSDYAKEAPHHGALVTEDPDASTTFHAADPDSGDYVKDDTVVADVDDDEDPVKEGEHAEFSAKHGLSTTTGADASAGASKGAGIGLGLGVVLGAAALVVPGFGLVVGGGALATALAGAALATGAGAVAGGVAGYLVDQGVPQEDSASYDQTVSNGGAVLALTLPSNDVGEAEARDVLNKYNARDIKSYNLVA